MGSALIETNTSTSPNFKPLLGGNYEVTLNRSIRKLLDEFHRGASNFSEFIPVLSELMQARVDPPLESIWVYSALSFRSRIVETDDILNRVAVVKDLFQLVAACSGSSGSSKSIALLAPVVFEVYRLLFDLSGKDSKREKKVAKEVRSLIEVILGYISICSSAGSNEDNSSIKCLEDLIHVWDYDREETEGLAAFFPLVSAEISQQFGGEECDVDSLAGVVIAEAFLLKMCACCRVAVPRADLEKELTSWAAASIAGFQNYYFYETVVKMLLEVSLPVTSLLSSEDEVFLRKILYDTVILADYSFLNPERVVQLPVERFHRLALTQLIVTHEAIEFLREHGDQKKPISYINAFSSSHLSSQLIKWASNQIGTDGKVNSPNGASPKALIKWLLNLEGQGVRIFDDSISRFRAKLVLDISKVDHDQPGCRADINKLSDDLLFYIDNKREEKDANDEDNEAGDDSMTAAFVSAARTMKLAEKDGERKRKKGSSIEKKKQIKFQKYNLRDNFNSGRESSQFNGGSLSSDSEIEDPNSDDENMEVKEE